MVCPTFTHVSMEEEMSVTGTVLVHRTMSLDGFVAAPDDDVSWIFEHVAADANTDVIDRTGAMLVGRRTYDVGLRDAEEVNGEPHGGAWTGPVLVLTHHPPDPLPDGGPTFLTCDVDEAVRIALDLAEGRDVEVLGTDVTEQCLARGVVDEIRVHVAPVLLGRGTRLVESLPASVDLRLLECSSSGTLADLAFAVVRDEG